MHQGTMHQTGKHKTKEEIPEKKIIHVTEDKQITTIFQALPYMSKES